MPLESLGISTIGKISTISIITLQFLLLLLFLILGKTKELTISSFLCLRVMQKCHTNILFLFNYVYVR
jgi:hypothetical protein